jgi:hypothetical protein
MYSTIVRLVNELAGARLSGTNVIRWGSPVPVFGDSETATVATLGLNPSNREFVDELGRELEGQARRFHTLASLGLANWYSADARHLSLVVQSCKHYFQRNPYDRWFRKLESVIEGTGASYYCRKEALALPVRSACHIDLIPFATHSKWINLTSRQRSRLMNRSSFALGTLLRNSSIRVLILNGQTVVDHFEAMCGIQLEREEHPEFTLPRQTGSSVRGIGYRGAVRVVGDTHLDHDLAIIGYNHNIQSSYGVTQRSMTAIRNWLRAEASQAVS